MKIISLVVGSLGGIPKQLGNRLKQIAITAGTAQVQKTVLLRTTRILRKVLEIQGYWLCIVLLCVRSTINNDKGLLWPWICRKQLIAYFTIKSVELLFYRRILNVKVFSSL